MTTVTVKDIDHADCIYCKTPHKCNEWIRRHDRHIELDKAIDHNYRKCTRCQDKTKYDLEDYIYGRAGFIFGQYGKPLLRGCFETNENHFRAYNEFETISKIKGDKVPKKYGEMYNQLYLMAKVPKTLSQIESEKEKAQCKPLHDKRFVKQDVKRSGTIVELVNE